MSSCPECSSLSAPRDSPPRVRRHFPGAETHPDATSPAPETRRGAWWYGPFRPGGESVRSLRRYLALPASVVCTIGTLIVIQHLVVA